MVIELWQKLNDEWKFKVNDLRGVWTAAHEDEAERGQGEQAGGVQSVRLHIDAVTSQA